MTEPTMTGTTRLSNGYSNGKPADELKAMKDLHSYHDRVFGLYVKSTPGSEISRRLLAAVVASFRQPNFQKASR